MRLVIAGSLAAGVFLAGCGSTTSSPPPVESTSQSGGVAAAAGNCLVGAPAQGQFREFDDEYDGIVGTISNDTGSAIDIGRLGARDAACVLAPGQGVAFAARPTEAFYAYLPGQGKGTVVTVYDPPMGYPRADVAAYAAGKWCGTTETSSFLGEGESWGTDTALSGDVSVKRLPDSADAAREWSGSSGHVDDWARIDIRIERVGDSC
jgi:hypothetical protein